jgi:hypothetical protein
MCCAGGAQQRPKAERERCLRKVRRRHAGEPRRDASFRACAVRGLALGQRRVTFFSGGQLGDDGFAACGSVFRTHLLLGRPNLRLGTSRWCNGTLGTSELLRSFTQRPCQSAACRYLERGRALLNVSHASAHHLVDNTQHRGKPPLRTIDRSGLAPGLFRLCSRHLVHLLVTDEASVMPRNAMRF